MGKEILKGGRRTLTNLLMLIALLSAAIGAGWSIWDKVRWVGVGLVVGFILLAVVVHFVRPPKRPEVPPSNG